MRKIYLLILMLLGIFYWIVVLDHVSGTGKTVSLLMILICLLIEILLIKYLRKEPNDIPLRFRFLIDLPSGIEWFIFFCFIIKALSGRGAFFEAQIEMQTLLFILTISLLVVPSAVRRKKSHRAIELKSILPVLVGFIALDRGLTYLELQHYIPPFYTATTVRFATSNLTMLMYVTWIVNVEFVKKQFLLFKD
ncbi:hypothetical protein [Fusibacter sp. 3D3]|uniref:hypothetical protein n=1 Tax=Fusibacter sp. 3D3 TaxID=1048380 RepID=UPI000852E03C|nr:hypothetical protein [Fusibacter sp. 3D3]GAU79380.1 hypothetical protein F3D3_4041 [Fusibacter sp. 3D3]